MYLEHVLIVRAWGGLKRLTATITESPSPNNIQSITRCLFEGSGHLGSCRRVGRHVHQPVSIVAVCVEGTTVLEETGALGRHKTPTLDRFGNACARLEN